MQLFSNLDGFHPQNGNSNFKLKVLSQMGIILLTFDQSKCGVETPSSFANHNKYHH